MPPTLASAFAPSSSRTTLYPQSKRKFFADLAQLLDEDPPEIRPLKGAFFGPELPDDAADSLASSETQTQPMPIPSYSLTGDSFDLVDFGIPRTRSTGGSSFGASQQRSSHNDSMADSSLFLP